MQQIRLALRDIREALSQYRLWLHLGLTDVRQRYRRSVLGPWWISISMFVFVVAMGKVFSRVFGASLADYMPFFTTGFLFWSFISSSINESTDLFKAHSSFIKQIKLPYNLYIFKFLAKNTVVLAHHFVVYFIVIAFFKLNPGWTVLFVIPATLLLILNLYWICLLVALVSARYRDMTPVINSCVQLLFFITPISWMPKLLDESSLVIKYNPFVYFLESVRQPLLGLPISPIVWLINISIACLGLLICLKIFSSTRARIPFWVD